MAYTPKHLKLWTLPEYYAGEEFPGYYIGPGQHRNSDALARSNFTTILRDIGGETDTVRVIRCGHWAVGWIEFVAIHKDDAEALEKADEIAGELENYPVHDEQHYYELEQEEANQTWAQCFNNAERLAYMRKYRDQFEGDYADLIANARGRWFSGYVSELLY